MRLKISKYFWNLNEKALKETEKILKDPKHKKFIERLVTFLSRCDKPKELFSLISKEEFIKSWPAVKAYWTKIDKTSDFRDWWQTIYEGILEKKRNKEIKPKGRPSVLFLKIGRMIREARIRKGWSQNELAFKVGMRQPDVSMIEEGKKNITLETLVRLSKVLNIKKIQVGD